MSEPTQVKQLEARLQALTQTNQQLQHQIERSNLLHEVSTALNSSLDFEHIIATAVGFSKYLGATSGEIHLISDTGEVYLHSTYPERNSLNSTERQELVRWVMEEGLDAWVLDTDQLALVLDTQTDERWLPVKHPDQTVSVRSAICAPIRVGQGRVKGALSFVHPEPNYFSRQDLNLLDTLTAQLKEALENAYSVTDLTKRLQESHLMLDISRYMSGAANMRSVHNALLQSISAIGADHCTLMMCQGLSRQNLPTHAEVAFIGNRTNPKAKNPLLHFRFALTEYTALLELVKSQNMLIVENLEHDERLSPHDHALLKQLDVHSLVITPLVNRTRVTGILLIAFNQRHIFLEHELAIYRILCDQTTMALEHVKQIERTEDALSETQTLYRAGRVLAGAQESHQILEEALVEFVYSMGLDQGGVVLLTPDKQFGQLMAYLEDGEIQKVENPRFPIDARIPYQNTLLSGQPYVNPDFAADTQLTEFKDFNKNHPIISILQAPMIAHGETIGWIGADSVRKRREFSQPEIDLARAMADQIAIAIQNRRLLEQSKRRADQLQAVALVGQAITGLTDLSEVLKLTVNVIRDNFGFYHVSIFLIDEAREWAVVKASTGEVGKIMVERPHKLGVGSHSIVGYVTYHAQPRIALDVGKDAVHFNNPLLPRTRSEMALPMVVRGITVGALDVQSEKANAFSTEDVETLQIMTNQITTALETARLFEETQHRLNEQAMLYSIGAKIGGTLDLKETTDILVTETAQILSVAECALTLLDKESNTAHTISDYVRPGSGFSVNQNQRFNISEFFGLERILRHKQELVIYADNPHPEANWGQDYLLEHQGSMMAIVPILLRNEVIGLIEIYDNNPNRRLSKENLTLLDSIALQAANAIENARLYENSTESQLFMKTIIDQIPDPIFIKDREHRFVVVNLAFARDIMNLPEQAILGKTDFDFLPPDQASFYTTLDNRVLDNGVVDEYEEKTLTATGDYRTIYTRKIPLNVAGDERPEYLIGLMSDVTEQRRREAERESLIAETGNTLQRTQTLYRISNILSAAPETQQIVFEKVLTEYLTLMGQTEGKITLFNQAANSSITQARIIKGQPVTPSLVLPLDHDSLFQHMLDHPEPLAIENSYEHPLARQYMARINYKMGALLAIPLAIRGQLVGLILVTPEDPTPFSRQNIEVGQAIADQLTIWLENRRLLAEAQHRSHSLQTTAGVARAASSILKVDELIETSVNLIRDQFDFYYVGLFLIDEAREWAVLTAGTGEAGRIQLERKHRLKIGGGSMIGWSIDNRRARIALDVGEEAVRFANPVLPDTHSEMALPLISRDEVLGALTVQSTQRLAFSTEDITLLQTMADQLANAIKNANLFTQTQAALSEAESLYRITQELSSARDTATVYRLVINSIARMEVGATAIYTFIEHTHQDGRVENLIEQTIGWNEAGQQLTPDGTRLSLDKFFFNPMLAAQEILHLEDIANNPQVSANLRQELQSRGISSVLTFPVATHEEPVGLLVIGLHRAEQRFSPGQVRYFTALSQQMNVALENLRLIAASQKRARREQIIREITGKIRNADNINDILKTTVTELSKVTGAANSRITLTTGYGQGNGNDSLTGKG